MKKITSLLLMALLVLGCAGCGSKDNASGSKEESSGSASPVQEETTSSAQEESAASPAAEGESSPAPADAVTVQKSEGVMTYAEYIAADLKTEVVIEAYVQAKQAWWQDKATVYAQDEEGAYFLYDMACSEEDYAKLTAGTKIKVTGFKDEWSGEVEIVDAAFEIEEGERYVASARDVTSLLGKDELIDHQNEFVAFKGMTVEAYNDNGDAFLYKWDGSGQDGDDLYFKVSLDGETYTFTVESYLCDNTTDVYAAVKALNVGDKIDMEGFLYWYEGVNPHITSVTAAK